MATASQAFIWLIAMDLLDKHRKKQFVIPVATFLLSELLIIVAVPYGPIHQWLYYTMRQVFLLLHGAIYLLDGTQEHASRAEGTR